MGIETAFNIGPEAEQDFTIQKVANQKVKEQVILKERKEQFNAVEVGYIVSLIRDNEPATNNWIVKEKHPDTFEVTVAPDTKHLPYNYGETKVYAEAIVSIQKQ